MKVLGVLFIAAVIVGSGIFVWIRLREVSIQEPAANTSAIIKELPYSQYAFATLATRKPVASTITIGQELPTLSTDIVRHIFYYQGGGRKISGVVTEPTGPGKHPTVVMARGYVEKEGYIPGTGTKNAATFYAENGYISFAPDFSGYGESDPEDISALGARLTKPVEILDLLASISTYPAADTSHVYLWGHSNGGQIMLSVSEILGRMDPVNVPVVILGTTLWAPVSKPFPYNILYYTDDADDKGKWLRSEIAAFEKDYDVYNYSIDRYIDWIALPIQIHQGSADESVPKKWSDDLVKTLQVKEKEVAYFIYPGADHNLRPSWDAVVARDLTFFQKLRENR